ncbi:hypothetical protein EJB05_15082 [Eragrostis curvula]|uniref:Uncharacterized protein n=1 Tax=Eragrostis curvula TaxID=38414 RepID=A0A5J9W223_9POAL|nr:hypothetical protein EJB05_15082 [Eragrostis curvula]
MSRTVQPAAMATARLGDGGDGKAAAGMPVLSRPKPNLADHIFSFCMKASIVLAICYFALLVYVAISDPQFGKLQLLPFFGVAVIVPFYAVALMQEYGT